MWLQKQAIRKSFYSLFELKTIIMEKNWLEKSLGLEFIQKLFKVCFDLNFFEKSF